jgi:hypothetical protein
MVETSQKKFVVDEGGNKRQVISAEDIKQTLNDLISWFKTNAPTYYTQKLECVKGASEMEVNQLLTTLGTKDESLKTLLMTVNGGF